MDAPERHGGRAAPTTAQPELRGQAVEDSQPVPVVAADPDASPFEIDEVEALPDEADGVLDLHEGASDFVPVTSADRPPPREQRLTRTVAAAHGAARRVSRSIGGSGYSGRVRRRSTSAASPGRSGRTVTPSPA